MLMRPDLFDDTRPLPLWQSSEFAAALRLMGKDADIRPLGLAGQAMIVRRMFRPLGALSFASRGPVWADDVCEDAQIGALRDAKLHVINADQTPCHVLRHAGFRRMAKPSQVAVLDVRASWDAQLAACKGKWRNAVRQGLRRTEKTVHRPYDEAQDAWIFKADRKQQRQKGYRALPPSIVRALSWNNYRQVTVSLAFEDEKPIAAMVFLHHGAAATYHIGWTNDAGRAANAHHVLLIQAAELFAKDGIRQIELGLIDDIASPGLARFKRGSGARVKRLGGTWGKVPFL